MLAHFSRYVRQGLVLVLKLHLKHRVGESLDNHGLDFDCFFFVRHYDFLFFFDT